MKKLLNYIIQGVAYVALGLLGLKAAMQPSRVVFDLDQEGEE
jgi:hypothetical protein